MAQEQPPSTKSAADRLGYRREIPGCLLLAGYSILAFVVALFACRAYDLLLRNPLKAEKARPPSEFLVVGLSQSGGAELVNLYDFSSKLQREAQDLKSKSDLAKSDIYGPIVFGNSDSNYRFFIEPARVRSIEKALTNERNDRAPDVHIELLKTDAAHGTQEIKLHLNGIEFEYFIYDVQGERVTPVAYREGPALRAHNSFRAFPPVFALLEVVGIAVYVVMPFWRDWREELRQATQGH